MTGDTLGRLLKLTALNPLITLPLFLAGKYTFDGGLFAANHATAWKHLKTLLVLGLADKVSAWLDNAVSNNWSNDTYVWSQEVVVVTGGSDGIGKIVVQLLAERGVKVAVLDVQELTYTRETPFAFPHHDCYRVTTSLTHDHSTLHGPLLPLRSLFPLIDLRRRLANP